MNFKQNGTHYSVGARIIGASVTEFCLLYQFKYVEVQEVDSRELIERMNI